MTYIVNFANKQINGLGSNLVQEGKKLMESDDEETPKWVIFNYFGGMTELLVFSCGRL